MRLGEVQGTLTRMLIFFAYTDIRTVLWKMLNSKYDKLIDGTLDMTIQISHLLHKTNVILIKVY